MEQRILLVSDAGSQVGRDEAFHCLAGIKNAWHVKPADAVQTYKETVEDRWDVVLVDCRTFDKACPIAREIKEINPSQGIVIAHNAFFGDVERDTFGVYVPKKNECVRIALALKLGEMV